MVNIILDCVITAYNLQNTLGEAYIPNYITVFNFPNYETLYSKQFYML